MASRQGDEVERKIYFYRADAGADEAGQPVPFDPRRAFQHINGLSFDTAGRYHEASGSIYSCYVDKASRPQRIRLAIIRRDALPYVEEGGIQTALDLPETAGLVEQIHVVFFRNNIVGCEFNNYGPRVTRLSSYLADKAEGYAPPVVFEPLLRDDVREQLEELDEVRLFKLRVRRSHIEAVERADENLGAAFRAAEAASDAEEVEVVLRPRAYSREPLAVGVLDTVKSLAGQDDLDEVASSFSIKGYRHGAPRPETIDVLGDKLITSRGILRQHPRARVLDSQSAYAAIAAAQSDLRDQLNRAVAITRDSLE